MFDDCVLRSAPSACHIFVFPTTAINVYPWGVTLNAVEPTGASTTRVAGRTYRWPTSEKLAPGGAIVERVGPGSRVRSTRHGDAQPEGRTWFHDRLAECFN